MRQFLEKFFAAQIAEIKENKKEFLCPELVDYALDSVLNQMGESIKDEDHLIKFLAKNSILMAVFILEDLDDYDE